MKNILRSVIFAAAAFALVGSSTVKAYQPVAVLPIAVTGNQFGPQKLTNVPSPIIGLYGLTGGRTAWCLSWGSLQFDSTGYTQARIVAFTGGTPANNTTSLMIRFQPNPAAVFVDNTFSDYLPAGVGSTDISVTVGTLADAFIVGPWTNLDASAIGDNIWLIGAVDTSNAKLTPTIGNLAIEFR